MTSHESDRDRQLIINTFKKFDEKGNGTVSETQLSCLLRLLDPTTWTDENVSTLLDAVCTHDGRVNYEVFATWLTTGCASLCATNADVSPPYNTKPLTGLPLPPSKSQRESLMNGYSLMRNDLNIAFRCTNEDLSVMEKLSTALGDFNLKTNVLDILEPDNDGITVWFASPSMKLAEVEHKFDAEKALLLYPKGTKLSTWASELAAKGSSGPCLEINLTYHRVQKLVLEDFDLLSHRWLARLWNKLIRLQGVKIFKSETELCRAVDSIVMGNCIPSINYPSKNSDRTLHLVGLAGSTSFFKKWTPTLLRHFANELMELNKRETTNKEIVICTAGYRNMVERDNANNQGVGFTAAQQYDDLGGSVIHVLPEYATEQDWSLQADQLQDGSFLPVENGLTLFAGQSDRERLTLQALMCDVVFLLEGGPGAAIQAKTAISESKGLIPVVPVRATGGAAQGKFDMPGTPRPVYIDAKAWAEVVESVPKDEICDQELRDMAHAMVRITWNTMHPLSGMEELELRPRISWEVSTATSIKMLHPMVVHICILGATTLKSSDSKEFIIALAHEFHDTFLDHTVAFVTCGNPGVQETFMRHCKRSSLVQNLVPIDESSDYESGEDIHTGGSKEMTEKVFAEIGDIYICIDGDCNSSLIAAAAFKRGAFVLPVTRTGNASSWISPFPQQALEPPKNQPMQEQWGLLGNQNVPVSECVAGVSKIAWTVFLSKQETKQVTSIAKSLRPAGLNICVLGGLKFFTSTSEPLVKAFARKINEVLPSSNVRFITGGNPGVQQTFAHHCGDGSRVVNLLPTRHPGCFGVGSDMVVGKSSQEKAEVLGAIGDIYITVEGGPGVAHEAWMAIARRVPVLPFVRSGGASGGKFNFPVIAFDKPDFASQKEWDLLADPNAPVEESAAACAAMVVKFAQSRKWDLTVPHWTLPKDAFVSPYLMLQDGLLSSLKTLLELYEKRFRTYGRWSETEEENLIQILESLQRFLEQFVERSRTDNHKSLMSLAYTHGGSKFRRVYSTIVQDVISCESAFNEFIKCVSMEQKRVESVYKHIQQQADSIGYGLMLKVYRDAHATRGRLNAFCSKIAEVSSAKHLSAPLKGFWRSLEKMVLKYSDNGDIMYAATGLKDVARAALQGNMQQLLTAFREIIVDEDVCIVRIRNRFAEATDLGWADCQIMLHFQNCECRHICEVQLVHKQLMVVRHNMGAHHEYACVRSASELLDLYGEGVPDLNSFPVMQSCNTEPSASSAKHVNEQNAICEDNAHVNLAL